MQHQPEAEWPVELDAVFDRPFAVTITLAESSSVHIDAAEPPY
jgi:hypothetical protein